MTRERDRYGRASVAEHVGDTASWLRAHPRGALALIVVVMLGVGSAVGRPTSFGLAGVETGDCLFVRTPSSVSVVPVDAPIGSVEDVRRTLAGGGAEAAPCDSSHGHEVSAVVNLPDPADAVFPGAKALLERVTPTCDDAFAVFIGHDREGSAYDTTAVVPSRSGWEGGQRRAVCLVFGRDGRFLDHQAHGSGE